MKLIRADYERLLEIPGVPALVRRPVDVDARGTGFVDLRSLRIYRFDAHAVVNGHAEEDEVFLVVMTGSVKLKITWGEAEEASMERTLSAPDEEQGNAFVAYLPPHSEYRLTPLTDADVAYARSTPVGGRSARVFPGGSPTVDGEAKTFIDDSEYAERLRIRYVQIAATQNKVSFSPAGASGAEVETLVHVRTRPTSGAAVLFAPGSERLRVDSWDTVALNRGDNVTLEFNGKTAILVLSAR